MNANKNNNTRSPRRRGRRRNLRKNKPLKVSFADRLAPLMPKLISVEPAQRPKVLSPPVPKPARDVLGVLLAATGFVLAARRNARVELLPGLPVTVVISNGRDPAAAFVLPISEAEARKAFGQPVPQPRDRLIELLFEEDRQDAVPSVDMAVDQEDRYAC